MYVAAMLLTDFLVDCKVVADSRLSDARRKRKDRDFEVGVVSRAGLDRDCRCSATRHCGLLLCVVFCP